MVVGHERAAVARKADIRGAGVIVRALHGLGRKADSLDAVVIGGAFVVVVAVPLVEGCKDAPVISIAQIRGARVAVGADQFLPRTA